MIKKLVILIFLFNTYNLSIYAQDRDQIKWGVETSSFISYSGVNLGFQVNGLHKQHSLGIGTKIVFQTSYFPYKNTLGLMVDYKFFIVKTSNIKSFISVNYGIVKYEVKNRIFSNKNAIHEYTVNNGFLFKSLINYGSEIQ